MSCYFYAMNIKAYGLLFLVLWPIYQSSLFASAFSFDGKYRYVAVFDKPISVKSLYSFDKIDIHAIKYLRLDFGNTLTFDSLGIPASRLQKEIANYNKNFVTAFVQQNKIMLENNKNKLTPQSLRKPEMRGIAVEAIEGVRRAKSFGAMSDNDPSIFALVFSSTPEDKKRMEATFSGIRFVNSERYLRMPPAVSAIQERYQQSYTYKINRRVDKPDDKLYHQLKKVAAGFYGVKLGDK